MDIAEGDADQGVIRAPMKPLYDFRRVLHQLPRLAEHDHLQAERLLLGLHERFWHAGVGDMTNLLIRAGMPKSVIGMISKSVAQCKVCNRFTGLPNRPGQDGPCDHVQPGDPGGFLLPLGEHLHADH